MATTIPTTGVEGYTPEQFEASGQTANVVGDTLIIASQSKKGSDFEPILEPVTYLLGNLGQPALTFTGEFGNVYKGGLNVIGSSGAETLTFGQKNTNDNSRVNRASGQENAVDKTRVRNVFVDLSDAGAADKFVVASIGKTVFKKTNVLINDSTEIKTNKGTFTSEDLNAKGKIKGLGGITFDVV